MEFRIPASGLNFVNCRPIGHLPLRNIRVVATPSLPAQSRNGSKISRRDHGPGLCSNYPAPWQEKVCVCFFYDSTIVTLGLRKAIGPSGFPHRMQMRLMRKLVIAEVIITITIITIAPSLSSVRSSLPLPPVRHSQYHMPPVSSSQAG